MIGICIFPGAIRQQWMIFVRRSTDLMLVMVDRLQHPLV